LVRRPLASRNAVRPARLLVGRSMAPGISMTGRSRARLPLCPTRSSWPMASTQVLRLLCSVHPSPQWRDRHQQSLWHRHRSSSSYVRHPRRSYASARFACGERFSYADGLPRPRNDAGATCGPRSPERGWQRCKMGRLTEGRDAHRP
jgi:hypothetical protein